MTELDREQIIKALECCIEDECDKCGCSFGNCQQNLMQEALDLIKELIEEIEFHKKTIAKNAQKALDVALEEIEKTKADTVRKMRDRLWSKKFTYYINPQTYNGYYAVDVCVIDQIAKEILEGCDK